MDISPKLNGCIQPCARPSGTIGSLEWEEFEQMFFRVKTHYTIQCCHKAIFARIWDL
jgi:hypothetical protein